jgi:hypothetical protein
VFALPAHADWQSWSLPGCGLSALFPSEPEGGGKDSYGFVQYRLKSSALSVLISCREMKSDETAEGVLESDEPDQAPNDPR